MSVVVVNDWQFTEAGDIEEGLEAATEYVRYFEEDVPELELSLWLRDRENPRHFFHIAVYRSDAALQREFKSAGTERFVERLYPEIRQDETFTAPVCDVVLSSGATLEAVGL